MHLQFFVVVTCVAAEIEGRTWDIWPREEGNFWTLEKTS